MVPVLENRIINQIKILSPRVTDSYNYNLKESLTATTTTYNTVFQCYKYSVEILHQDPAELARMPHILATAKVRTSSLIFTNQ